MVSIQAHAFYSLFHESDILDSFLLDSSTTACGGSLKSMLTSLITAISPINNFEVRFLQKIPYTKGNRVRTLKEFKFLWKDTVNFRISCQDPKIFEFSLENWKEYDFL